MTRQQRMIEAFADYEAATRNCIDQENIEILIEMGWTREDATAFVHENPAEGENGDNKNKYAREVR